MGMMDDLIDNALSIVFPEIDEATAFAKQSGLPAPTNEGPGDALRHMYGAAISAQRRGYQNTVDYGGYKENLDNLFGLSNLFRNEQEQKSYENSRLMDERNNQIGAHIGFTSKTPEEALQRIYALMELSANQDSKWSETNPTLFGIDERYPVIWNRQHYREKPPVVKGMIGGLRY
mgnify:CR=1 FL=1